MLLRLPSHWMSSSFSLSIRFIWLIDTPFLMCVPTTSFFVVDDFETVFQFTAVTPVESDASWLVACCSLGVFFYSIMEATFGWANIVVCTVVFVNNWHFSVSVSGAIADGLIRKIGSNIVPSARDGNLLLSFLDDGLNF